MLDVRVLARLSWASCKIISYISSHKQLQTNLKICTQTQIHTHGYIKQQGHLRGFAHQILEPFKLSPDRRFYFSIKVVWWQCSWSTRESENKLPNSFYGIFSHKWWLILYFKMTCTCSLIYVKAENEPYFSSSRREERREPHELKHIKLLTLFQPFSIWLLLVSVHQTKLNVFVFWNTSHQRSI